MERSQKLFDDSWRDSGRFAEQFPETTVFMRFPWMREYCKKGQKGIFSRFQQVNSLSSSFVLEEFERQRVV
ncbi:MULTISPECIES: hypothetical protein [Akkermansia]|jgi:hypothetical protein|uniref:hypothetical protein n=1 Tax=Akkermansia TaxID=239934 RepID=UPI0011AF8D88|nr:hypothetical protein [Akkermansia massiliensis]MBD9277127.1 hypothetical protein [Akkermansia muciniphila]MBT8775554.1 hypothetical protein [Akkermansia muciniphila]